MPRRPIWGRSVAMNSSTSFRARSRPKPPEQHRGDTHCACGPDVDRPPPCPMERESPDATRGACRVQVRAANIQGRPGWSDWRRSTPPAGSRFLRTARCSRLPSLSATGGPAPGCGRGVRGCTPPWAAPRHSGHRCRRRRDGVPAPFRSERSALRKRAQRVLDAAKHRGRQRLNGQRRDDIRDSEVVATAGITRKLPCCLKSAAFMRWTSGRLPALAARVRATQKPGRTAASTLYQASAPSSSASAACQSAA